MDIKKRPFQRHFPYQHPTFGTKNRPKPESAWKKSVYYWWWAYLKRNAEYVACCDSAGSGKLADLYADFGDVRGDDFKAWWSEDIRGVKLFAEPRAEDSVRIIQAAQDIAGDIDTLTINIPLNLPKKFILKRFSELLAIHHKGERGRQLAKQSNAKYQFVGQPNLEGLKLTLEVYDFWLANSDMKLWEIGNSIPKFMLAHRIRPTDPNSEIKDKKNILAATVSRYVRKAKGYVASTGDGRFL